MPRVMRGVQLSLRLFTEDIRNCLIALSGDRVNEGIVSSASGQLVAASRGRDKVSSRNDSKRHPSASECLQQPIGSRYCTFVPKCHFEMKRISSHFHRYI